MHIFVSTKQTNTMNTQEITNIILSVKGKNVISKRVAALEAAGFKVSREGIKWNFGRTGTVKEVKGGVLAQLKCATGGRSRSGYGVNACEVYRISQ
jgi:NAD dependent epimerase/dehydratase family enzyme